MQHVVTKAGFHPFNFANEYVDKASEFWETVIFKWYGEIKYSILKFKY